MTFEKLYAAAPLAFALSTCAFTTNALAEDEDAVTVSAPSAVEKTIGRDFELGRTHEVTMSARVSFSGLDLRNGETLDELKKQIKATARDMCAQKGLRVDPGYTHILNPDECYRNAVYDARRQLDSAIARANANLAQKDRSGGGG